MEDLARERAQILNPLVPWYNNRRESVAATSGFGIMTRVVGPPLRSAIQKRNEQFAKQLSAPRTTRLTAWPAPRAPRTARLSGRIHRMPAGSGKDYYVYWPTPVTRTARSKFLCLATRA